MGKYTTIAGDTWDAIAKKVYNDDHAFERLMDANPKFIDVLIFSGGDILNVPEVDTSITTVNMDKSDAAAWREMML